MIKKKVNAIIRASDILRCLARGDSTLKSISSGTGLSASTTHRLLKSLEVAGFATQDPLTRRYGIGPLIPLLALNPASAHQGLISSAREEMERLRQITGETVALVVRMGMQRVQLLELESSRPLKYTAGVGFAAPLYCGATGKVILSEHSDEDVEKILDGVSLVKIVPNTITDRNLLEREIASVRINGYAVSHQEMIDGTASMSAPIKNYFIPVALSILAPEFRFPDILEEWYVPLKKSCQRISGGLKKLGADMWGVRRE